MLILHSVAFSTYGSRNTQYVLPSKIKGFSTPGLKVGIARPTLIFGNTPIWTGSLGVTTCILISWATKWRLSCTVLQNVFSSIYTRSYKYMVNADFKNQLSRQNDRQKLHQITDDTKAKKYLQYAFQHEVITWSIFFIAQHQSAVLFSAKIATLTYACTSGRCVLMKKSFIFVTSSERQAVKLKTEADAFGLVRTDGDNMHGVPAWNLEKPFLASTSISNDASSTVLQDKR